MRASVAHRAVVTWLLVLTVFSHLSSTEPAPAAASNRVANKAKRLNGSSRTVLVAPSSSLLAASCSGPAETGNCRAAMPRWFYNKETSKCEGFIYGGCGGNGNNYKSVEECRVKCEQTQQKTGKQGKKGKNRSSGGRVAVVVGTSVNLTCQLNSSVSITWVFYPQYSFQVVNILSGSQSNENISAKVSFDTSLGQSTLTFDKVKQADRGRYECFEEVNTNDGVLFELNVYPAANSGACSGPAVTGNCRAWMPKWYFDADTGKCRRFIFGGCDGSDNKYDSRPECERTCLGRPSEPTAASPEGVDITTASPVSAAEATEVEVTPTTTTTTTTAAAAAAGDKKKIKKNEIAKTSRVRRSSDKKAAEDKRPECTGLAVTGRCRGAFQVWFYNEAQSECQQFIYGGCGGNENRHSSREQCEQRCRR